MIPISNNDSDHISSNNEHDNDCDNISCNISR